MIQPNQLRLIPPSDNPQQAKQKPNWRERRRALRYVPALLRMVWETHRGYAATMVLLRIVRAFVPLATLWVGKLIIDAVLAMTKSSNPDWVYLWELVALELGVVVLGELLARASSLVESLLGDLFSNHTSIRLMQHAATLDLYHFEAPAFYDRMERARRQTVGRISLVGQILTMGQNSITLISLSAAIVAYNPWLLLLLATAVVPSFLGETHFASLEYSLLYRWTPERRQLDYLRYVGASDETAKEVQMFGLAPWLIERYRLLSDKFYDQNKRLSIRKAWVASALSFFGTLGYYGAYVLILVKAAQGLLTIGTLTFLASSFARSRDLIGGLLMGFSGVVEQSMYLKDLFEFFEVKPTLTAPSNAPQVPQPIREGFLFQDVGFRYPDSERWAVRHLNFTLRPGERIALVGENGAGKTTITKLLARLYDPTEGRILLDGRDLREYDVASVRRAISVIFQDFVRYDFRFDENIGVGEIELAKPYLWQPPAAESAHAELAHAELAQSKLAQSKLAHAAVAATEPTNGNPISDAARKSLADTLLPRFGDGYGQMLGRRFKDGVELSGGEWQKVALARSYMRQSQALILDEPTAALDARAEYEVFLRFSELVAGRMAIIISHRFSTVRMADRIIVLQHGEVVEEGSHVELVKRGGLYSELFELQAEGYR